ncbi:hypothetical protein ACFO4U_12265 [Exiguobacterium profundum]|uniref:hypothetical protein n=1 Tax=Exiguobacterium TaxID=33986 RepID=UPI001BFC73D9|nr:MULTISPECIES: hypothetical protein [Exiguobacterium]MCT4798655.1 hypothetical protein [Exiguobacterium profundum]MDT0192889.1 hypothetical protein [Exiguobacterium sp. BG5(2022)]
MESKKDTLTRKRTSTFQRYLLPITLVSSLIVSGSVSYIVSKLNQSESEKVSADQSSQMKIEQMQQDSLAVIEEKTPKILNDLNEYEKDLSEIVNQVELVNEKLFPIRDLLEQIDSATLVLSGVNSMVNNPLLGKVSGYVSNTNNALTELDAILFRLEHLSQVKADMKKTRERVEQSYSDYQNSHDPVKLIDIEKELDSELIYQIEDIRNSTVEAHEALEISSKVLLSVNKTISTYYSFQSSSEKVIQSLQFWKEKKQVTKIDQSQHEQFMKELDESSERLKNLPEDLAKRSNETISSINSVKSELQMIRLTEALQD